MKVISLRIEYLRLKQISQEDKHILYSQRDSELVTFSVASIRKQAPQSRRRSSAQGLLCLLCADVQKMQSTCISVAPPQKKTEANSFLV